MERERQRMHREKERKKEIKRKDFYVPLPAISTLLLFQIQTAKLYPSMADSNEAASPLPISDKAITRKMIKRARMRMFTKRKKQQRMNSST
jgi:hypothetical protein